MSDAPAEPDPEAVDLVRRRLLLVGGRYIAPAVVASVWFQGDAFGQGMSGMGGTGGTNGTSCNPLTNVCPPNNGCPPFAMMP